MRLFILLTIINITNAFQKTKIEALRTVQNGESLHPNTRFPVQFIGDWSSVLLTDGIDVMVDHDTTAINTNEDEDYNDRKINWSEGPLWDNEQNCLYFSDPTQGIIFRIDNSQNVLDKNLTGIVKSVTECVVDAVNKEKENRLLIWAIHAGGVDPSTVPEYAEPGSNGLTFDAKDPSIVYVCQHYNHSIVKSDLSKHEVGKPLSQNPSYKILTDSNEQNQAFNSPNDIITYKDGLWFTDPIYGFLQKDKFYDEWNASGSYLEEACHKRTGVKGVYRYDLTTEKVRLMIPFHRRPNGLAIYHGEDGDVLWVADSTIGSPSWTSYSIPNDITNESFLTADKVITQATLGTILGSPSSTSLLGHEGVSDGFKIDSKGRLWTSIPNGFAVIDVTSTKHKLICRILLGVNASNVSLDGEVWFTM